MNNLRSLLIWLAVWSRVISSCVVNNDDFIYCGPGDKFMESLLNELSIFLKDLQDNLQSGVQVKEVIPDIVEMKELINQLVELRNNPDKMDQEWKRNWKRYK